MAGEMKWMEEFDFKSVKTVAVFLCFVLLCLPTITSGDELPIISIKDGEALKKLNPQRFCYYNHLQPGWKETWTRIQIQVRSSSRLKVTVAQDEQELKELEQLTLWSLFQYILKEGSNETSIAVSLFRNKTCFRVEPTDTSTGYVVQLTRRFDICLFMVFLAGLFLFFYANALSRSQVFFYSAGMSTGLIASLIILIFIVARFLPKKSPFFVLIFGGWSFSLYLIQMVFRNLQVILREHWHYAVGYVSVVGFISFAVCYRHGPLVEERSINILSWTLQLLGLFLVYIGIQVQQVALALIIAAFCSKNLEYPVRLGVALCRAWRRICQRGRDIRFAAPRRLTSWRWTPQPRRLLTEEEYQKQGEVETQHALEELREYCNSPEFKAWRAVSRLQSPKRFADFMEGSPHLTPNEVSAHAHEYDLGGSFLENELFGEDEDEEEEEEERMLKTEEEMLRLQNNHRRL
ncbi:nuclear envelope integral membrane protein 1 isoform X1 [Lepisosteus oculatus]|uniref:nuclear envelope integral membrane protein 1 isoform X1 n=1 Tax=Lepisosteus oculatus TaxID=7918 RepID=UPI0035F511D6